MQKQRCVKGLAVASAVAAAAVLPSVASAFGMMEVGEWEVEFGGNVNGYVTQIDCDAQNGGVVSGGLACGSNGVDSDHGNVRTGFLPAWFGFHAQRTFDELTAGITISFQPGIDGGSGGIDTALSANSSNFRQVFLEFTSASWGTIKIGRDLGVFGSDAILNDITLLGTGTVSDLIPGGGRTTLGRIGAGYVYADWKAQVQYISPDWDGFQFKLALVDPWGLGSLSGLSATSASFGQETDTYGFEGTAGYSWTGDVSGKVWASLISQAINGSGSDQDATGFDFGVKVGVAGFEVIAYFYDGEAIGNSGFLFDALDLNGNPRDTDGGYVQATYKVPGAGTKIGLSFGETNLDLSATETAATSLVKTTESIVFGVYHPLNDALNLVAEFTQTESVAHNGARAEESVIALGAILFY